MNSKDRQFNNVAVIHEIARTATYEALQKASKTCMACIKFDEPSELCKFYNARPPARIIAFGCDDYINAYDIPF